MNLTYQELSDLMDRGYHIYEIWKSPIYIKSNRNGDYHTDSVLQVQAFSDTNRLPVGVTKKFSPIKKLIVGNGIHRWSYGAGYSVSSDIDILLEVFRQVGYPIVRIEEKKDSFGRTYLLYYVAKIMV